MRPKCDRCGRLMQKVRDGERVLGVDSRTHEALNYLWKCFRCGIEKIPDQSMS